MSDDIVWEEPPAVAGRGRPRYWEERLTPLVDRPGEWARVTTRSTESAARGAANNIRRGMVRLPSGRWEATYRTVGNEFHVYARYLGADEESTPTLRRAK